MLARCGYSLVEMLLIDWLHNGPLCCFQRVIGSAFISLACEGRFGHHTGQWAIRMNNALKVAYGLFLRWAKDECLQHSQKRFSTNTLSCSVSGRQYPDLKGKAHNATVVRKWLAAFCQSDSDSEEAGWRASLLWGFDTLHSIFSTGAFRLSQRHVRAVDYAGRVILASWTRLGQSAHARGEAWWTMIPKTHMMQHLLVHIKKTRRNPGSYWTFSEEGLQHQHKQVGLKTHKGNVSLRVLEANLARIALALEGRGFEAVSHAPFERSSCRVR